MSLDDDSLPKDSSRGAGGDDSDTSVSFEIPELPEIDLPDIPLPDIPELDLDSLLADNLTSNQAPTAETESKGASIDEYGSHGSGPVSIADMKTLASAGSMAPPGAPPSVGNAQRTISVPSITTPDIKFEIPESAGIQDTGMGSNHVDDSVLAKSQKFPQPVHPKTSLRKGKPKRRRSKSHGQRKSESSLASKAIPREPVAQAPLGEQVFDFEEAKQDKVELLVDLQKGYFSQNGTYEPIDTELLAALTKIFKFLHGEFSAVDRAQIWGKIRKAAKKGESNDDLLKLLIKPILRLGKKRYSVIDQMLELKQDLPKLQRNLVLAFLKSLLMED